jgi:hypothetical protein
VWSLARKNLEISLEKYKIGNITQLEIREAQRNYLDAQSVFFGTVPVKNGRSNSATDN